MLSGGHVSKKLAGGVAENERISAWLLRKELTDHYLSSGVNGA
jgi:hypothetical protein